MRNKRNAKFFIDLLASRVSLIILGGLTVWLGISVFKEANRKHTASDAVRRLETEKQDLEAKNNDATALLDSLKDAGTLELEAKRRLNLKKIGEEVAVILRGKNEEPQSIAEPHPVIRPGDQTAVWSNPLKWWRYIANSRRD